MICVAGRTKIWLASSLLVVATAVAAAVAQPPHQATGSDSQKSESAPIDNGGAAHPVTFTRDIAPILSIPARLAIIPGKPRRSRC